jgi:hypothetical protein
VNLQAGTLNSGSSIYDLFDGRPLKRVSFDTNGSSTGLLIRFDFAVTSGLPFDFVAILNHNLYTAEATRIEVRHHTSAFTSVSDGTAVTLSSLVGGTSGSGGDPPIFYPTDGSTVSTFTEVNDKRYWAIVIKPYGATFSGTDLEIGQILLGRKHYSSVGPDVASIRRSTLFDGIELNESVGGQTYANAAWIAPQGSTSAQFGAPFRAAGQSVWRRSGGRRQLKFRQHFMLDTETTKSDLSSGTRGATFDEDVIQATCGGLHPLVFCPDSTSTTLGDYMFARIKPGHVQDQVAQNVVSYDMTLTEEF